jgi:hypothetical protein
VTHKGDTGSDFRFEATIKLGIVGTRKRSGGSSTATRCPPGTSSRKGTKTPSRGRRTSSSGVKQSETIERGMDPQELPENPGTMLEILYYLDMVMKHRADE